MLYNKCIILCYRCVCLYVLMLQSVDVCGLADCLAASPQSRCIMQQQL